MSKKDVVYDLIIARLLDATYRFGQKVFVKDLVEETGASRQPVMSALSHLAADGFVRIAPQVGCQVINPSSQAIHDFYLMFAEIEALLAGLAAARRGERELEALRSVQADIETLGGDGARRTQRYALLNQEFHGLIHDMAHSDLVAERHRSNFDMSDFFIAQTVGFRTLIPTAMQDHRELIEAIDRRHVENATAVARRHIHGIANAMADEPAQAATG